MSPQLAAGLTALVGICMVAGWVSAFRNRTYLGLLGLAFLALSGFFWTGASIHASEAAVPGSAQTLLAARVLLGACLLLFLLAGVAAVRETVRRLHEIRTSHREAEEAMVEFVRASLEKEKKDQESESEAAKGNTPSQQEPD